VEIHWQSVEAYGEGAMNKGMWGNGVGCSKKAGLLSGMKWVPIFGQGLFERKSECINWEKPCTKWLALVSSLKDDSVHPESDEWPREKWWCAGLAERLHGNIVLMREYDRSSHNVTVVWRSCLMPH
jgi:hypothetical protein